MKLTKDQVKHVAKLADLPISPEEEKKYSEQLSKILDYAEQLNKVDANGVEPTFNVTGFTNIMREDEPQPGLSQQEALSEALQKENGMFITRGIFKE